MSADERPVVSIIIPTHNRAHLVSRAISSVLAQSIDDWECLVVDDCSTDDTERVVRAVADARVRYHRLAARAGASAARNAGIRAARGAWLAFLDSDDEWLPQKLERQLALIHGADAAGIGAVGCGVILIGADSRERPRRQEAAHKRFEDILMFRDWKFSTSCLLVSRTVIDAGIAFDESLPSYQDWDLTLRIARGFGIESAPEPLIRQYRDDTGPHVWNREHILRGQLLIMEKYRDDIEARPAARSLHHYRLARMYARAGDIGRARRHAWIAFRARPWHRPVARLLWRLHYRSPWRALTRP